MLPMIEVMKQFVERFPFVKSRFRRNNGVVTLIKLGTESTEHPSNSQVKFMMPVEGGWIKHHWNIQRVGINK